jgi:hypothetical protein
LYWTCKRRISGWSRCISIIERVPLSVSGVVTIITTHVRRAIATA